MAEISALSVKVTADTADAERGLDALGSKVGGVGSAISTALGAAAVGAVAGLGAAFVGSVKSAGDFEKQMSAVGAVAGASASEMEALTKSALQLGKDTSFSATEAAQGIEELVKAGVAIGDVIGGGAKAALDLAAAGAISVGDAAEIASNAMNVFNIAGADMGKVADTIAGAANASAIGVNDYKFSLAAAGAVAATVGVSFESLSQAIAVMGNAGIKGSDAGTSLKTMMLNLQPTTAAQIAEFERLGIAAINGGEAFSTLKAALLQSAEGQAKYDQMAKKGTLTTENMWKAADKLGLAAVKGSASYERWLSVSGNLSNSFFDAEGKAKSFAEIADVLQDAMAGMTKEQQLASLEILFGADAIRAAAVMAEAGAEGFAEMADAMGKVTAAQVAEERLNNLWGSIEKLKGSLETAAIILGSLFTPALKGMADTATTYVNQAIEIIEQLPDAWRTAIQAFEGGWEPDKALSPFINMVGKAGLALRDLFGPTVQAALAGDLKATLAGLGSAFDKLAGMMGDWLSEQVAKIPWAEVWRGVKLTAQMVFDGIAKVVTGLDALLSPWLNQQIAAIDWAGVGTAFGQSLVSSMNTGIGESVSGGAGFDFAALDAALTAFLVGVVTGAWEKTLEAWRAQEPGAGYQKVFVDGLDEGGWRLAIHNLGNALTDEWNANRQKDHDNFRKWNDEKTAAFTEWATATRTAIQTWNTETTALVTAWVAEQVAAFTAWDIEVTAIFLTWVAEQIAAFQTWNTDTTLVITTWATNTLTAFTTWWADALTGFTTWITDVGTTLSEGWDAIWSRVGEAWNAIWSLIGTKLGEIAGQFTTAVGEWIQAGTDMATGLVTAVGDGLNALAETVLGPIRRTIESVRGMLGSLTSGSGGAVGSSYSTLSNPTGVRHGDLINAAAQSENVPADVIAGIMGTEGSGDQATSGAGAHGPMQVMPFHFRPGEDSKDPATNIRVGARVLRQNYERYGNWESAAAAYYGAVDAQGRPTSATDGSGVTGHEYVRRFSANRQKYQVAVPNAGLGDITVSQAQWGTNVGMTPQEAAAACGPYAAYLFAQATGRTPSPAEAEQLARAAGWTEAGMGGTGNFMKLLGSMGVNAVRMGTSGMDPSEITRMASNAGPLTGFSTPGHYFASTGFDPSNGKFNVGATGTYAGGSTWMTVQEMSALMGPIQDIITLGGQMGVTFSGASTETTAAFQQMGVGATVAGQTMVSMSTDSMGNVTRIYADASGAIGATITDASGAIVNAWGTMATGVTTQAAVMSTGVAEQTNLMASGALTSVTNLGTGILTSVQTTSGTTIATVTDMQGQVTAQYATLANGVTLTMGDMAAGVMTSTTDLGTGIMTTVQDTAGNYITTITDLAGNVTAQYTQLATDVVATTTAQTADVTEQTAVMAENVLTSVTDLGDGILTITNDTAGNYVATVTDMAGNVVNTYTSMSSDVQGSVEDMAGTVVQELGTIVEAAENVQPSVEEMADSWKDLPTPKVSGITKAFDSIASSARKAMNDVDKLADKTGSFGSGPGKKNPLGKAAGGPVNVGETYLVGERGPELFSPWSNGTIIPNHAISTGGGGSTDTLVIEFSVDGRTAEKIYVTGKQIAARRGRD